MSFEHRKNEKSHEDEINNHHRINESPPEREKDSAPEKDAALSAKSEAAGNQQPQTHASQNDTSKSAEKYEEEIRGLKDKWLRAVADLDNYRKRFNREVDRMAHLEKERILRELLPVIDSLERALMSEGAEKNPMYDGIEATLMLAISFLKKFGAEQILPSNEMFDPQWHEAVATANIPNEPEGKIIEVIQPGYKLDNNCLRPAKVIPVRHIRK